MVFVTRIIKILQKKQHHVTKQSKNSFLKQILILIYINKDNKT